MSRAALNPSQQILHRNAVTINFENAFENAFNTKVLPERNTEWVFRKEDSRARLYCHKRQWLVDNSEPEGEDESFSYEKYLEKLFWNRPNTLSPLIIIEGEVGSGKSTLVEFFLRCYCPTEGSKTQEFDKKIPVIVDLSSVTDENFEDEFYRKIRKSIESFIAQKTNGECQLDEINGYKMYDHYLKYDSQAWKSAIRNKDEDACKADEAIKFRGQLGSNHKEWVELALRLLSYETSHRDETDPRKYIFRYLVICLDNIDQRPDSVQKTVLQVVKKWINEKDANFWQIYIPLWPRTYNRLKYNQTTDSPIGNHIYLQLGLVDPECIREKRNCLHKSASISTG